MSQNTASSGGYWSKFGYIMDSAQASNTSTVNYITRPLEFPIDIEQANGGDDGIRTKIAADDDFNFCLNTDGSLQWGSGSAAYDTTLSRTGVNELSITGTFKTGTLYANSIITNSGDLSILSVGGDVSINGANLNDVGTLDVGKTSITVATDGEVAFESGVSGETYKALTVSGRGEVYFSSGFIAPDTYLYRNTNTELVLSSTSLGSPGGSFKTGSVYASNFISNSGDVNLVANTGGNVNIKSPNNTIKFKNSSDYSPFEFDLSNYAISVASNGFSADTFIQRTGGATLTLGTTLGATNGTFSTQTFVSNGSNVGTLAQSCNVSGDSQARHTLDMDGQLAWSSGSANRDVWLYRNAANTLTLSTSSRGGSSGALRVGSLREVGWAEINNGTANTYNSTTPSQSVLIGQAHDLISPVRALVQGSGNTYYRASSSAIIGSTNSVLTANSSSQANHVIAASTDVLLGTATGTNGNNCMILASNGSTGSCIIGNSASRSILKGAKIECNYSDVVMFADDGVGYGSLKAVGTNNVLECHFKSGYYFTTNALRTAGVQAGANATSWSSISDLRLKQNITPLDLDSAYDAIDKVRVVNFSWKDDSENKKEFGMVAQEVQSAFEFIPKQYCMGHDYTMQHPDEEPIGTVCGDHIAYLSLALIKHQKKLISELEGRVEQLENKLSKLSASLI